MGLIGVIIAVIYVVGGIFYDIFVTCTVIWSTAFKFLPLIPLRLLALIVIPLPFAIGGFIVGTIGAFLNNFVVDWLAKNKDYVVYS